MTESRGAGSTRHGGQGVLQRKLEEKADEIAALPEVVQLERFLAQLDGGECELPAGIQDFAAVGMDQEACIAVIRAGMATQVSHVESRKASVVGEGYYTIGPGGEELLAWFENYDQD